jgi:hypothetical protein
MKASPLVLMLQALVELVEQGLDSADPAAKDDLLLVGRQLHRLNGVYIRLVETRLGARRN